MAETAAAKTIKILILFIVPLSIFAGTYSFPPVERQQLKYQSLSQVRLAIIATTH